MFSDGLEAVSLLFFTIFNAEPCISTLQEGDLWKNRLLRIWGLSPKSLKIEPGNPRAKSLNPGPLGMAYW